MHRVHAKSIRYCVALNSVLCRHLPRSPFGCENCIGKFCHSADCGDTGRAHTAQQTATTNISSTARPTDKPKTSIIIFECVAASLHVDGDFYLPFVVQYLSLVVACNRAQCAVIVQLFSNFRYTKTIWPRNLPIESLLDGIRGVWVCASRRAYIL